MRRFALVVCSVILTGALGCGDKKTEAPKDVQPLPKEGPAGAGAPGAGGNQPKAPQIKP